MDDVPPGNEDDCDAGASQWQPAAAAVWVTSLAQAATSTQSTAPAAGVDRQRVTLLRLQLRNARRRVHEQQQQLEQQQQQQLEQQVRDVDLVVRAAPPPPPQQQQAVETPVTPPPLAILCTPPALPQRRGGSIWWHRQGAMPKSLQRRPAPHVMRALFGVHPADDGN